MTQRLGHMFDDRRSGEDRRDEPPSDPAISIRWSLVAQIIAYALTLFTVYNALSNRVTAVETRVDSMRGDISEMKADVKTLLTRKP